MLIAIVSVIVLIIIVVVMKEMKNSKKYKEDREEEKNSKTTSSKRGEKPSGSTRTVKPKVSTPPPAPEPEPIVEKEPEKELPVGNYSKFDHSRIVDTLGLSEEDAGEFIGELISQVDTHIAPINDAVKTLDIEELERLTHSIKGSATNLGSGGIADLLTDFNTYLKEGEDRDVIERYAELLEEYYLKLKQQYN